MRYTYYSIGAAVAVLVGFAVLYVGEFLFAISMLGLFVAVVASVFGSPPGGPTDFPDVHRDFRRAVAAPPVPSPNVVSTTPGYGIDQSTVSSRT